MVMPVTQTSAPLRSSSPTCRSILAGSHSSSSSRKASSSPEAMPTPVLRAAARPDAIRRTGHAHRAARIVAFLDVRRLALVEDDDGLDDARVRLGRDRSRWRSASRCGRLRVAITTLTVGRSAAQLASRARRCGLVDGHPGSSGHTDFASLSVATGNSLTRTRAWKEQSPVTVSDYRWRTCRPHRLQSATCRIWPDAPPHDRGWRPGTSNSRSASERETSKRAPGAAMPGSSPTPTPGRGGWRSRPVRKRIGLPATVWPADSRIDVSLR